MNDTVLLVCHGLLALATLLGVFRLFAGPTVVDRILAFDLCAIATVGQVAVVSLRAGTTLFLELIIIFSLIGFTGTVVLVSAVAGRQTKNKQEPAS